MLDILVENKTIGMNHLENKICRGIDQRERERERWDRTMYANGISQKLPTHSLVLRETNMWMKRGNRGKRLKERMRDREREGDVKRTLDRAIINLDVLSCQDRVNEADMTQMKSRTLMEYAEKYMAIFRFAF